jgi:CHAT domain-containing protein
MSAQLLKVIFALLMGFILTLTIPVLSRESIDLLITAETVQNHNNFTSISPSTPINPQSLELSYLKKWQLARLRQQKQDIKAAIAAYQAALAILPSFSRDEFTVNKDTQIRFYREVEPVYRELVSLLLTQTHQPSPEALFEVIKQIDALQLAELENFLGCNLKQQLQLNQNLEQIDPKAALFYPIILPDRLEVIFKLPGQPLNSYRTFVSQNIVEETIQQLRTALLRRNARQVRTNSENLYQWLLQPIEEQLRSQVETLVFVLDGDLRNIPLAVLYDRENNQYLLEKPYDLALLPSSNLFSLQAHPLNLQVLGGGISEEIGVGNRNFSPLNAAEELNQIGQIVSTRILLNSEFTEPKLRDNLNSAPFSVVHLATHGNFSSDPLETFILAYGEQKARGELLRPNDLNSLLRSSNSDVIREIELMVLSACQTALGDNRATLGLAGLAVRSGARSTLATLWQVSDESTVKLMQDFYSQWSQGNISKAKALHQAQQQLLKEPKYQNPYYWAAYVLVGNWL